jgi:zinc protease
MTAASNVAPEITAFDVDGLRVIVRRNPAHEVVGARLYLRGGAANATVEHAGVEAMAARAARRGTRRYSKHDLHATLARLGADLGAAVFNDATVFNLRCLKRDLQTAWDVYADVVTSPLLEPDEVEVVRKQMLLGIRQRLDSPDGALAERAREHCFAGHPYAADPHGTEAAVTVLGPGDLRSHTSKHWTRANALLVVSGDVTPDEVTPLAAAFSALPRGDGHAALPPRLHFDHGQLVVEQRTLPTNYILGDFAAPALRDADHPAMLVAMSVLRDRFFEEVRTKRNLSYAPSASLGNDAAAIGSVYVTAVDPVTTIGVMRDEMRRLLNEPLEAKELGDKVRTFVTRYWMQNETNQAQAAFLGGYELFGGGWEKSRDFVARLEALAPADVQQVARKYLRAVQWVYLGDPAHASPDAFVDP